MKTKAKREKCYFCGERHGRVCPEFKGIPSTGNKRCENAKPASGERTNPLGTVLSYPQIAQRLAVIFEATLTENGGLAETQTLWPKRTRCERAAWLAVAKAAVVQAAARQVVTVVLRP